MLDFPAGTKNEAKCNVTYGSMGHLDPKQPPVKRKPFATILNHGFIQKVEFILPEELYQIIKEKIPQDFPKAVYSRVILPLKDLVDGDFFNEYIKKGNILMLSQGRAGVENVYSLKEGILTLHLNKESYERAGLVGKPEGVKGERGSKPRWIVEINLRLPSMLHGKKGFDRIVYAFKNVLNTPVTWLFYNLSAEVITRDPLCAHFPIWKSVSPEVSQPITVKMPVLKPPADVDMSYGADFEDYAVDIHEWLSLVLLDSPRINANDKIDSFLSRYVPPGDVLTNCNIVKVKWRGFLSPSWAHKTFVQMLLAVPQGGWFACCVVGLGDRSLGESKSCTALKLPDSSNEYVLWDLA